MEWVTPLGMIVRVGQVWRDRDKRSLSGRRHCIVTALVEKHGQPAAKMASCRPDGTGRSDFGSVTVLVRRMHPGWAFAGVVQP